jgi:hypothetical protein
MKYVRSSRDCTEAKSSPSADRRARFTVHPGSGPAYSRYFKEIPKAVVLHRP